MELVLIRDEEKLVDEGEDPDHPQEDENANPDGNHLDRTSSDLDTYQRNSVSNQKREIKAGTIDHRGTDKL